MCTLSYSCDFSYTQKCKVVPLVMLFVENDPLVICEDEIESDSDGNRRIRPSYEDVLTLLGIGKFHVLLVILCGWANASDAVEVLCVSLVLPSVQCDLNLTSEQLGVVTAVIFLGMMLGGYFWGSIGDVSGRRMVLICSLFVNGLFGLLSSFAETYWTFVLCRFFSGVGVGGSVPVIWSYYVEWIPAYCRGRMLSFLASFWMVGQLITAGFAWFLIPYERWSFVLLGFSLSSWRIFMILSTIVCLSSSIFMLILPESPKYLFHIGKRDEAVKVLEKVFRMNKCRGDFNKIRSISFDDENESKIRRISASSNRLRALISHTRKLFSPVYVKFALALLCINFTIAFGYYGLMLWFPELFSHARSSGVDGPICRTTPSLNVSSLSTTSTPSNYCRPAESTVFRDTFVIAASNFPGNIVAILFLDKFGRKKMFVASLVLSACSVFMIWIVENQTDVLIMSCVFSCVSTVAWNCLDCFSVESFPTELRATAIGLCLACARIGAILGNLLFGSMIDANCALPIVIVAVLLIIGAASSMFLPEKTKLSIS